MTMSGLLSACRRIVARELRSAYEAVVDGMTDVRNNKLRTFLQTLGVVLGVAHAHRDR